MSLEDRARELLAQQQRQRAVEDERARAQAMSLEQSRLAAIEFVELAKRYEVRPIPLGQMQWENMPLTKKEQRRYGRESVCLYAFEEIAMVWVVAPPRPSVEDDEGTAVDALGNRYRYYGRSVEGESVAIVYGTPKNYICNILFEDFKPELEIAAARIISGQK